MGSPRILDVCASLPPSIHMGRRGNGHQRESVGMCAALCVQVPAKWDDEAFAGEVSGVWDLLRRGRRPDGSGCNRSGSDCDRNRITEEGSKEGSRPEILPGWGIVQTGWLGMSGMLQVAEERKQELGGLVFTVFMKQILSYQEGTLCKERSGSGGIWKTKEGGKGIFVGQIGSGGILAALWNLSKETKLGLDMNMKAFLFCRRRWKCVSIFA